MPSDDDAHSFTILLSQYLAARPTLKAHILVIGITVVGFTVNGAARGPALRPARDITRADVDTLRREFSGGNVLVPGDPTYGQVKFFNGRFDHIKPAAIIQPTSEAGVLQAIQWAHRNGIRVSVKGGGHHYEGHSKIPGAVIDLSKLKMDLANQRLEVDPVSKASLITVGAGNNLGQLYSALAKQNRVVPAGTAETVGVIGHVLGGGVGDMGPHFGYATQSLERVRLMTFTGKTLDISDAGISEIKDGKPVPYVGNVTGAEVMKALRGGGQAAFGIITQATLKTHDTSKHDMRYFEIKPSGSLSQEQTVNLVSAWQKWQSSHPEFAKDVSSKLNMTRSGNSYNVEVSGVIATTDPAKVEAIKRSMSEFRSQMGGSQNVKFSATPQNIGQIFNAYKDPPSLFNNDKRNSHIVRSAMVPDQVSNAGVRNLVGNMISGGDNPVTIYAMGGAAREGLKERTSLQPGNFIVELETVNGSQQALDNYHKGFMAAAGLDHSYANYPGNGKVITNPAFQKIRDEFNPPAAQRVAHSPLADTIEAQQPRQPPKQAVAAAPPVLPPTAKPKSQA